MSPGLANYHSLNMKAILTVIYMPVIKMYHGSISTGQNGNIDFLQAQSYQFFLSPYSYDVTFTILENIYTYYLQRVYKFDTLYFIIF